MIIIKRANNINNFSIFNITFLTFEIKIFHISTYCTYFFNNNVLYYFTRTGSCNVLPA